MFKRGALFISGIVLALTFLLSGTVSVYASEQDGIYDEIDEYLGKEAKQAHIPGMAVMIVDKENVLLKETYGNCISIDAPFIIGSNSKSFTAAAVMQLAEQGLIDLDEHIAAYIPDIREGDKITVRQLLNHTSGIRTYDTYENYKVSSGQGQWMYANVNYSILGRIIEAVSGTAYTDYVKEHLFGPLDMEHTYTSLQEAKSNGLVHGYRNYFGIMVKDEVDYPDQDISGWLSIPAGYIISSASDMGKHLQFYLNGGMGILKPESIETMFYDTVKVNEDASYGFAWGTVEKFGEPVIYHNGLVENYISYMFILPESEIGGVILMNCNDYLVANGLIDSLFKGVLSLLVGEEPQYIGSLDYETKHLVLDAIYLAITALCILPLFFIGRWRKRNISGGHKIKAIVGFIILHILVPTLILVFPATSGVPYSVIKGFVPDICIILVVNAAIAYCTGIIKIILFMIGSSPLQERRRIS
jgi:CubicO group peptidase (beta-lactamase class C family)